MGIKQDAGKLLIYIYKKYQEGRGVSSQEIVNDSNWDNIRTRNAVKYLKDRVYIKVIFFLGGNFFVEELYPEAIDIVENNEKFLDSFGFSRGNIENFSFEQSS